MKEITHQPLVSIITVVYNGERTIERTLKSVLAQSYKNIEYIVIDGASTDSTLTIIKQYEKHISCLLSEPDAGLYHAMNKGIALANGTLIGILNSGDFYLPNTVQTMVDATDQFDAEIVYGDWITVDEREHFSNFKRASPNIKQMNNKQSIAHPTCFVKKAVYGHLQAFNTTYQLAADYDFLLRCMDHQVRFQYVAKVITACAPGGLSNSYKCDFEAYQIQKAHRIPHPYKYIYRGLKCYCKELYRKFLPHPSNTFL